MKLKNTNQSVSFDSTDNSCWYKLMKVIPLPKFAFACLLFFIPLHQTFAKQLIKYIGIEQGLSNNSVTCITKDKYGFMWMGTYNGLNRYDGDKFKTFRNILGDSTSLINNYITAIAASGNKIFIGTQKGINYYDYTNSSLTTLYYLPQNSSKLQKISSLINALKSDRAGNVFIATDNTGLLQYTGGNRCTQIPLGKDNLHYTVQALTLDAQGKLWLFIKNNGLYYYDAAKKQLVLVTQQIHTASCLLKDQPGHLFIGTENGLFSYDISSGNMVRSNAASNNLRSNNITDLSLDKSGNLWIATNGDGVNIQNLQSKKISYLLPGNEQGTLKSGAISGIFDDQSRKWIATLRGGVNVIDDNEKPFKLYTHDPFNPNSVINNFIISFCEDQFSNVFIGTDGGGMSYWDTQTGKYQSYQHSKNPGSISSNFVVSVLKDFTDQIWVATFHGGIDAFNRKQQIFKHYSCYNTVTKKEDDNLWKLFEDTEHNLWAGMTRGDALYKFNRQQDKFELFDNRLVNIHVLFQDKTGILWAGDYSHLIKIDTYQKKHQFIAIGYPVRAITQVSTDTLCIGTDGGGLLFYSIAHQHFTRLTEKDGLPSNTILNILTDHNHNIWCSTYNGISRYSITEKRFSNYTVADGLQSNQFNYNAALKLKSGDMLFGGINGFNLFNPDSLSIIVGRPDIRLTNLKINNIDIDGNNKYTNQQPIVDLKKITIPFEEATLSVDYTALEYSLPDKINYTYYMEGWDHGWNYVGRLKTAYYTRLGEGNYTLKIKATDTNGRWSGKEIKVLITILPPWYRSWWAYLLYLAAITNLVYWFWRYRIGQTKLKYEVTIANLKVEKEKEINEKKLSFFTNVSHEFRTPLTLIINPIKDLLRDDKEHHEELKIVYRNARRLLGLVDHLLLFRKTESENTELKIVRVNFIELCKEVYSCFTHQTKIKQISYNFQSNVDTLELYLDKEKIEIALFNLISNAVKFTPDGGHIDISIRDDEQAVYFEIADSGIGINTDIGERLFDKFYQVKDANSLKTGFGIGLYLVKTFIENHQGSIAYTGTEGGGTTFMLSLPKGKAHLTRYAITESANEGYSFAAEELIDYDNPDNKQPDTAIKDLALLISDRQSVLVIDDNQEIRSYIKKIFASEYVIYEAENGTLGLELIKKYLPDVIISDIVMPGLTGLELCEVIKSDSSLSHIPIILLTGESEPATRLQGIEGGAVDFISKPFDKDLLVARVKGIIKNKTELQNYFYSEITLKGKSRNVSEEYKDFIYKFIEIVETSLKDPELDVNHIAYKMGMSYSSLNKKIRLITDHSLNGFVRFIRLRKAAELMINTNCNVNEAAYSVGVNDIKYFREHFYKQFGLNPSDFIRRHRLAFQKSYSLKK